jgi:hypothetical protein
MEKDRIKDGKARRMGGRRRKEGWEGRMEGKKEGGTDGRKGGGTMGRKEEWKEIKNRII